MRNKNTIKIYPYAWLDEVVEITLNPIKTNVLEIQIEQLKLIEVQFNIELKTVLDELKMSTFNLFSSKKIKATVGHYYNSLRILEQQILLNMDGYPKNHPLFAVGENLVMNIHSAEKDFKKRYSKYLTDLTSSSLPKSNTISLISKIMCKLSVDQLGIIFKAADESKLIVASSISLIFQSIVPFLSTPKIKNISWNSMRKSTYQIEEHDKQVAITALENLITKIKGF